MTVRRGRSVLIVGVIAQASRWVRAAKSKHGGRALRHSRTKMCGLHGDESRYYACHAVCVQRVEDEEAYLKALGR
jgi:hypothetical protein